MTNFDYLLQEPAFGRFARPAIAAEKVYEIDPESAMFNVRKSAEQALKFMVQMEHIGLGPDPTLADMTSNTEIKVLLGPVISKGLDIIRKLGNKAVHESNRVKKEHAELAFKVLYALLRKMAYLYSKDGSGVYNPERKYNPALLEQQNQSAVTAQSVENELKQAAQTNEELQKQIAELREQLKNNKEKPAFEDLPTEDDTRKQFIDVMLENAGWTRGRDWREEVEVSGMPTKSGIGKVDYVLYGDDGIPLAVIEAKKTQRDPMDGLQQARLYAKSLEKKYHRKPVIFLSNGLETWIDDNEYPERRISDFYSKRDLEKLFNIRKLKQELEPVHSSDKIAGRYYQKQAIAEVCRVLKNMKRRALLVMATGSGKTRTAAALIDYLVKKNWVKNVLFLADRTMLVSQAKKAIVNNLPNLSVTNLSDSKENPDARVIVSTYQTMLNCIDKVSDENGRIFTPGHFDLIICDEVHRSIYNKYQDIFTYFDAPIIGLTATPKEEVDRDTYKMFQMERGNPTYAYTLEQGVKDHVLVPYEVVNTGTKFIEEGITYDDLSEEEQEDYDKEFKKDGVIPYHLNSGDINKTIFNKDTIRQVLATVMEYGLKVDSGSKLGKTIIFARNHQHAKKILEVFNEEYPYLGSGFAQIIDNYQYNAEQLKEDFENPNGNPQVAISVDMLDTGVDVPSILNLVFFKKVRSKTKFFQMIGRGTRLCENLIDGKDKEKFLIFDFFGNFEEGTKFTEGRAVLPVQGAIFMTMLQMVYKLQEDEYQTPELQKYRDELISTLVDQVKILNRTAFNVHQHLKFVEEFSKPETYKKLTQKIVEQAKTEIAHLIQPSKDDIKAVRLDALIYGLELNQLNGKKSYMAFRDLRSQATELKEKHLDIPEVKKAEEILDLCIQDDLLENANIDVLELVRKTLRPLVKYIEYPPVDYHLIDYKDTLKDVVLSPGKLQSLELEAYDKRARKFIKEHQDLEAIRKLRENEPLTNKDYEDLERILWGELGTKADYEAEYHDQPIGRFVRSITGLDQKAAKEAFAKYIDEAELDSDQINFVNEIIEYLTLNGTIDRNVLRESPFSDLGGPLLFSDNLDQFAGIMKTIDEVNSRADKPVLLN